MMSVTSSRYLFNRLALDKPRQPGISALMRIKNGEEFLRQAIESHLPFYDEIIAVYNGCTDNTALILQELAAQYPDKIRVFHYEPTVYPVLSQAHQHTPSDSVHSMANYYNFALAQASFSYAVKLDDDHLAIASALAQAIGHIRADIAKGKQQLYSFSGLNLALCENQLGIYGNEPLVGTGDIVYFPVNSGIYFHQNAQFEALHYPKSLTKSYLGLLYLHLKHVKRDYGFTNLPDPCRAEKLAQFRSSLELLALNTILLPKFHQQLIQSYGNFWYWFRSLWLVQTAQSKLSKREAPLRWQRIARWQTDVQAICWQRDLWCWLANTPQSPFVAVDLTPTQLSGAASLTSPALATRNKTN